MYIQITTRCNMRCAHCAFSCTAHGEDMSRETFLAAVQLAEDYGESITVGGGEPTVHPLFWDFIGLGIVHSDEVKLHVITNGKIQRSALKLANLARSGTIGAELSQDRFHERVDTRVVEAFTAQRRYVAASHDLRGIRSVSRIVDMGRAATTGVGEEDGCVCDELFVTPNGTLWACAHQDLQFGTVFQPEIPEDYCQMDEKCSERMLVEA